MVALYRTVIIEDDAVITQLNKRYVEKDSRFQVVRTFSAAHPALFWLRSNPVDLIILDVYMPQMSGLELLRALRAEGVDADVIMVTSANDAATIEAFMRLGVLDHALLHINPPTQNGHTMPKGLQSQTMNRIEDYLRNNQKQGYTCDDVASHVGLSVVTVRRYMNYLVEQQIIDSDMDYSTGGRPCIVYYIRPKV